MVQFRALARNTCRRLTRPPAIAAVAVVVSAAAFAAGINDTGQTACFTAAGAAEACTSGGQDGRYGRDAANAAGAVSKPGAGVAGFDFSKIANNGTAVVAGTALGTGPSDWGCTRDNVTGLMWEVKTGNPGDLRYMNHAYTWYSTAPNNGGIAGDIGTDTCAGTLGAYANQCNTANYILAVNAAGLCGANDWRLPTIRELEGIKHFGAGDPAIDATYFPNTVSSIYFSASTYALLPDSAWVMYFQGDFSGNQSATAAGKGAILYVRLVRGGP